MTIDTYNRLVRHYGPEQVAKMFPRAVKALGLPERSEETSDND